MKKWVKTAMMLTSAALFASFLTGCGSQEKPESESVSAVNQSALQQDDNDSETIKNDEPVNYLLLSDSELEELWKQEEAYGRVIQNGYDGGICQATIAIAQLKGFFADEGIESELIRSESARDAIGAGKLDTSGNFIAAWAVPAVNGVNMKFVAGANTGCQSLYVLADSGIETTSDLIGKRIAVPNGIGNSSHNITLRFLGHDNLDPNDFEFLHIENSAVILAMQNDEVDAVTMSDQFAKKFVQDGTLKVIRSITYDEDFKNEACCIFAINGDFLENNPITSMKLSRAYQKAGIWYENNKEEAIELLLEEDWISGDYDYCLLLAQELNFDITETATEETLRDVVKDYQTFGLMPASKTIDEIMDQIWFSFGLDAEREEWN